MTLRDKFYNENHSRVLEEYLIVEYDNAEIYLDCSVIKHNMFYFTIYFMLDKTSNQVFRTFCKNMDINNYSIPEDFLLLKNKSIAKRLIKVRKYILDNKDKLLDRIKTVSSLR